MTKKAKHDPAGQASSEGWSERLSRPGIPTTYRGVRFRSRLEAKWAAFFDGLGWPWEYEPFDLNGYIPDFVLPFDAGPLLVEVKPDTDAAGLRKHAGKIAASGWDKEALIVGATIRNDGFGFGPVIGEIGIVSPGETPPLYTNEAALIRCRKCRKIFPIDTVMVWNCRVCGEYDGDGHLIPIEFDEARSIWVEAANRVQWRAR